jgi:hypothetical protein
MLDYAVLGEFSPKSSQGHIVPNGTQRVWYVTNKSQSLKESSINLRGISKNINVVSNDRTSCKSKTARREEDEPD